ncbi:transposase InsO family protein [Halanaerobium saccharolyticum]|jgi:transposase InsO family protein|uniref:Transposase InsO family protein n=3 Tax=Halanaerobium TaxID=2330 RepID=A0A2T5RNX6_9FIRM|nr:transposase InsO family protein [Halanaerobium saccharolyticum]SIQ69405.1 Transposase InsO and inactivated derivatives [Halanaerobium kushneri]
MDIVEESTLPVKTTCEILKLNSWRYYYWRKRYETDGMEGLKNHKSTPAACPHSLLEEEKQAIIDYALKHPDQRHRKLAKKMMDDDIVYVSASSAYRVLKEGGLIPDQEYHKKKKADGKIEVDKPNKMWHTDISYIPVKNTHAYLICVLDGYSRKIIHGELSQTMTADDMQRVLSRAMFKAGIFEADPVSRPALVSDNGTQLVAKSFTEFLEEWEIKHIRIAVKHPETNGKIEVFHKTIKYENVYAQEKYQSFYEAREDIENFIDQYNSERLHQGIGFVTPDQKYNGKADKIINERKKKHQSAIDRRKRLNRKRKSTAA